MSSSGSRREWPVDLPEPVDRPMPEHTFLFADLAGYTALTEAHGDDRAADVAERFCDEVGLLLPAHEAELVKSIGDAVMLHCHDAARALGLGLRLALELGSRHGHLAVRVGIHTGTAVQRGDDWFGAAVNVAARAAAAASAGQVLATLATRRAAGRPPATVELLPAGARRLRNVAHEVELFAVVPAGTGAAFGLAVDPVCQMAVDPERADAAVMHRGVRHHFCSAGCADAFAAEPSRWI